MVTWGSWAIVVDHGVALKPRNVANQARMSPRWRCRRLWVSEERQGKDHMNRVSPIRLARTPSCRVPAVVVSLSLPTSSPDRPTLCHLRFQDIHGFQLDAGTNTFIVCPSFPGEDFQTLSYRPRCQNSNGVSKVRARFALCFLRTAAYGWSRARLCASPRKKQRMLLTIPVGKLIVIRHRRPKLVPWGPNKRHAATTGTLWIALVSCDANVTHASQIDVIFTLANEGLSESEW